MGKVWHDRLLRALDIVAALVGCVAALPFLPLIALFVLIGLGRPITFRQTRMGLGCRPFTMIKFRSMTDARDRTGALLPDEARTPFAGRFLRRSRLDELPELWNVLIGDMSIIGPRPLLPETIRDMGQNGVVRCTVRPGLTGWAQINGNARLTNADKLALDLWYIERRSFGFDLLIIAKTIAVMLFGERINPAEIEEARRARGLAP
jgi:lipopolysaccharide/colanic/teichoic acid biosynthesis glycosyltransferase